jgi:hypothetical protein
VSYQVGDKQFPQEIEEHYGRIDILVNNAGSMVERATLSEMTENVRDRVMDVNLRSVYLCSQAVLPIMKQQGGGRIINMTSVSARDGGSPNSLAYSTAKGGVSTLTRPILRPRGRWHKGQRGRPRPHRHPVPRRVHHRRKEGRGRTEHSARRGVPPKRSSTRSSSWRLRRPTTS